MNNRFVFVVPMFDASKTLARMLHSVCGQSYENWKVVLIDDRSSNEDRTCCIDIIRGFRHTLGEIDISSNHQNARRSFLRTRIETIWNDEKRWEVANVLEGLTRCAPNDIVCRLDADDWLTELDALAIIDAAYQETGCDALWTAHRWGFSDKNISGPMPRDADPYMHPWVSSHLKTWRKSLSDGVNDVNYRGPDGAYIKRAGDQAVYLPVLAHAQKRVFLPRVTYHYSIRDVPETYQTDDAVFQRDEALFLRQRGYVR